MWVKRQRRERSERTVEGAARNRGSPTPPTHRERCKCEIITPRVKDVEFVPWGVKIDKLIKWMYIGDYVLIEFVTGAILERVFIKIDKKEAFCPRKTKKLKKNSYLNHDNLKE